MNRKITKYIAVTLLYFTQVSLCDGDQSTKQYVMQVIQSVDPTLSNAQIVFSKNSNSVDPTLSNTQIVFSKNSNAVSMSVSLRGGLPKFTIDPDFFMSLPFNEQRFVIAHELAHYMMGHFTELYKNSYQTKEDFDLIENARIRVQENEADRIAIVQFRINIDDAIAFAKRRIALSKEDQLKHPERQTFAQIHPLWLARIQYLEELRREVEIQRTPPQPVNWDALAENYSYQ